MTICFHHPLDHISVKKKLHHEFPYFINFIYTVFVELFPVIQHKIQVLQKKKKLVVHFK